MYFKQVHFKLGRSYTSSDSRAVLSPLHDATIRPSGLKHTDSTESPCPSSVLTHAPVSASHSRTVVSMLPNATCRPSGLKHTENTLWLFYRSFGTQSSVERVPCACLLRAHI